MPKQSKQPKQPKQNALALAAPSLAAVLENVLTAPKAPVPAPEPALTVGDIVTMKSDAAPEHTYVVDEVDEADTNLIHLANRGWESRSDVARATAEEIARFNRIKNAKVGDYVRLRKDTNRLKAGAIGKLVYVDSSEFRIFINGANSEYMYWDFGEVLTAEQVAEVSTRYKQDLNSGIPFVFVRGKNAFNGSAGWKPKAIPDFDPVASSMVLHDLCEHVPGSPATPEEEFKAIGSAMYLRHEGGYFGALAQRASDALAAAFGMLYFHAVKANRPTAPAPTTEDAIKPLENVGTEMEMVRAIGKARDFLKDHRDLRYSLESKIDPSLVHALGWMRVGYRLARKRFEGLDIVRLASAYRLASDVMEKHLTNSGDGTEMTVTFTPEEYKVDISVNLKNEIKA